MYAHVRESSFQFYLWLRFLSRVAKLLGGNNSDKQSWSKELSVELSQRGSVPCSPWGGSATAEWDCWHREVCFWCAQSCLEAGICHCDTHRVISQSCTEHLSKHVTPVLCRDVALTRNLGLFLSPCSGFRRFGDEK